MARKRVKWDGTEADKEKLRAENPGMLMLGLENHEDGDALIFGLPEDIEAPAPQAPPLDPMKVLEARVDALALEVAALKKKP